MSVAVLLLALTAIPQEIGPPARELARELQAAPRLAGTAGSLRGARFVRGVLEEADWSVELDSRDVCLALPRRLELAVFGAGADPIVRRVDAFDPDADPVADAPKYNAWSASARVRGPVFHAGRGLRADFERLREEGFEFDGKIALAAYGGSYRGVKPELAEAYGCAGVLLYSPPSSDGASRGPVWPDGPWKPGDAAQRGSISQLARAPGDPTTPGWPSPAAGETGRRLDDAERDARLPRIPCLPIGADDAVLIRKRLKAGEEVEVLLDLDVPREVRTIHSVIARLPGAEPGYAIAGNHRDAWVRGAQDAGSGTVSLLRAAQRLGERARDGWKPRHGIVLGFWDAEEFGLIGSTEWAEAHAAEISRDAIAYVNADATVAGTRFNASGTPGLLGPLRAALERVAAPGEDGRNLWEQWSGAGTPRLGLPGSGSDYAVFLHHLGVPVLDVSFSGNSGGQYHTAFDDFEFMERFLDPGWVGHETAGLFLAELLAELAERGLDGFDDAAAAARAASETRAAGEAWLPAEPSERIAVAFDALEHAIRSAGRRPDGAPRFYQALEATEGLPGRPWYRNRLWAPGLETGYAAETLPTLRVAVADGEDALKREVDDLVAAIDDLRSAWEDASAGTAGK